jgi:hypothetical protein
MAQKRGKRSSVGLFHLPGRREENDEVGLLGSPTGDGGLFGGPGHSSGLLDAPDRAPDEVPGLFEKPLRAGGGGGLVEKPARAAQAGLFDKPPPRRK